MNIHTQRLITRLGYQFADLSLLDQALTHRSFSSVNNERLEFLGDAILGVTIAEQLFRRCSQKSEGSLTRMRASLVKKETLAEVARELDLGPHINLGGGELKSGGARRDSILADTLEAIIGAIFIDSAMEDANDAVLRWFNTHLENCVQEGADKDPKTALQEYLQARGLALPDYQVVDTSGEPHQQQFTVACILDSLNINVCANSTSKRSAEKLAAGQVLKQIGAK